MEATHLGILRDGVLETTEERLKYFGLLFQGLKEIGFSWSFRSPGTTHGSDGMQKKEIDLRLGCEAETSTFLLGGSADRQIPSP